MSLVRHGFSGRKQNEVSKMEQAFSDKNATYYKFNIGKGIFGKYDPATKLYYRLDNQNNWVIDGTILSWLIGSDIRYEEISNEQSVNKASTEGMCLRNATGEKVTKEMLEQYIQEKKEGKIKGGYIFRPFKYYKTKDDKSIKYEYKRNKAFILNQEIKKWIFSEEISAELMENPNAYERDYYFYDVYENEWEEPLENSSNLNRYFQTGDGSIVKINTQKKMGYILDYDKSSWIFDSDIYQQIKNKSIVANEILFDDKYREPNC